MTNNSLSPIEIYLKKSIRILLLLTTLCAFCASATFTILKILGFYPTVSLPALIIFDIFDVICFIIGQILSHKCVTKDGIFHKEIILATKICVLVLIIIQWNFITYMIPSRDFWAYASLFVLIATFYMDHKYILLVEGGIGLSMIVAWIITGDRLAPVQDEYYLTNTLLRIILIVLLFAFFWFLTYFTQKLLVKPMETIADFDPLTGLRNRRTMYNLIENTLKKNESIDRSTTILLCDIDDFKKKNDTYGHSCGDFVLKNVADTINAVLSDKGIAFRYGGEEFIIMIDAGPRAALDIAENIRQAISEAQVIFHDISVAVTVTIGAAESNSETSIDDLISLADKRMYQGKLSGKNTVVFADN